MKDYISVAITGHIDLLQEDKSDIIKKIDELYHHLRQTYKKPILLYSALAPGADTWAAERLSPEDHLAILIMLPDATYKEFTFNNREDLFKTYKTFFRRENTSLKKLESAEDLQADRYDQYVTLGKHIVKNADILIALWDGVDNGGIGGTSDVVKMWVKGRSINGEKVSYRNKPHILYHLPVRRQANLFPVQKNEITL